MIVFLLLFASLLCGQTDKGVKQVELPKPPAVENVSPVTSTDIKALAAKLAETKEEIRKAAEKDWLDNGTFWLLVGTTAFTLVMMIAAWRQAGASKDMLASTQDAVAIAKTQSEVAEGTLKAAQKALKSAQKQAKAARGTLAEMRRQAEMEFRPLIAPIAIQLEFMPPSLTIRNVGRGVALSIMVRSRSGRARDGEMGLCVSPETQQIFNPLR